MNKEVNLKFKAFHRPSGQTYWFDIMNGNQHGTGSGYISMTPIGEEITKTIFKDNMIPIDPTDCDIEPLYSTPPPSEASREKMKTSQPVRSKDEIIESMLTERGVSSVRRLVYDGDDAREFTLEAMETYASQFPAANVTQGEVERIKADPEKVCNKCGQLYPVWNSELTQLRTTIDDQAKEIERLNIELSARNGNPLTKD